MSVPDERSIFTSRCLRLGQAADAAGVTMRKAPGKTTFALELERSGTTLTCPILTDAQLWRETTVEEALYSVLLDAREWSAAKLDDEAVKSLDAQDHAEAVLIKRDLENEREKIKELADLLGGDDRLQALFAAAGL